MTRSEPGPTVKVEPSTSSTCTRPLVVVLMRSLKKIDLPILSWLCGDAGQAGEGVGIDGGRHADLFGLGGPDGRDKADRQAQQRCGACAPQPAAYPP